MRVFSGYTVKYDDRYSYVETSQFSRRLSKYVKNYTRRILSSIDQTVDDLCTVSDSDILIHRYSFHKLNNYSLTSEGKRYDAIYDVHVPTGGSNNNNDLVILFTYDHDNQEIILLDIGSHKQLNISGSYEVDEDLIYI